MANEPDLLTQAKVLKRCDYFASRGPSGMSELVNLCKSFRKTKKGPFPEWVRRIPLHGAMMNGHVKTTGLWLVNSLRVHLETTDERGNTALHHAIIWGRVRSIHFLLARGADVRAASGSGESVVEHAEGRQRRLETNENKSVSANEKERLLEEGKEMIELLRGVVRAGSYAGWARTRTANPNVALFMPHLILAEHRMKMGVLRALTMNARARLRTKEEMEARALAEKMEKLRLQREKEMSHPMLRVSIDRALADAGLDAKWSRDLKMLGATEMIHLRNVEQSDIGQLGDLNSAEKRALWLWVKDKKENVCPPPSAVVSNGTQTSTATTPTASKKSNKKTTAAAFLGDVNVLTKKSRGSRLKKSGKTKKKGKRKKKGMTKKKTSGKTKKTSELSANDRAYAYIRGLAICYDSRFPDGAFSVVTAMIYGNTRL